MTEKGGNRWGRAVETGRDEGRAEWMGWVGAWLTATRGSGLGARSSPLQGGPLTRLLSLGEASTLGGDQVVGGKVGRAGGGRCLLREREGV